MPAGESPNDKSPKTAGLPLDGVRVVEFCHMVMGPTCGLVLADMGADVIKVEPLEGDKTRMLIGAGSGFFPYFNRNKRSLALDLKSEAGMAIVRKLIAGADVVTENFRPGAMDKLGLGYETLKRQHPALIYCSLKGFLKGPYDHRTALDEVVQMMGGLAYMTGPTGRPLRAGASINDIMGGIFGTVGILAALRERDRTGHGQLISSALFETCVMLIGQHMAQYAVTGTPASPMPERLAAWAIYEIFDTRDDKQVFLGVVTDTQWEVFCREFERPDLFADETLNTNVKRAQARDRLIPIVKEICLRHTKQEMMDIFERIGLPFAPITKPHELYDDPHLKESGGLLDVTVPGSGKKTKMPALPFEMAGRRFGVRHDIPAIGRDSRTILSDLGYADAEIDALVHDGIVRDGAGARNS
jgi:crotonobetainyl-CoA:carnitine CoA-transferase CaiB-like acyl-CoA transferase